MLKVTINDICVFIVMDIEEYPIYTLTLMELNVFDYLSVCKISNAVNMLKKRFETGVVHKKDIVANLQFPKGQYLQLTVKITDPILANIILQSGHGGDIGIPGMALEHIRSTDLARRDVIIAYLHDKLSEVERKISHSP